MPISSFDAIRLQLGPSVWIDRTGTTSLASRDCVCGAVWTMSGRIAILGCLQRDAFWESVLSEQSAQLPQGGVRRLQCDGNFWVKF